MTLFILKSKREIILWAESRQLPQADTGHNSTGPGRLWVYSLMNQDPQHEATEWKGVIACVDQVWLLRRLQNQGRSRRSGQRRSVFTKVTSYSQGFCLSVAPVEELQIKKRAQLGFNQPVLSFQCYQFLADFQTLLIWKAVEGTECKSRNGILKIKKKFKQGGEQSNGGEELRGKG